MKERKQKDSALKQNPVKAPKPAKAQKVPKAPKVPKEKKEKKAGLHSMRFNVVQLVLLSIIISVASLLIMIIPVADNAISTLAESYMRDVDDFLYIRSSADGESEVIGKLYKGAAADIVETLDGWYHITSGSVDGYVKSEYCVAGQEAYAYAQTVCDTVATVTTGGLRVRSEANPDASVIKAASEGDKLVVDTQTESPEGWVAVSLKNSTAFVSADYVTVSLNVASAVSMEEERAALEEKAAEEAAKKAAQTTTTMVTQNASVAANCDEVTLLAALIQCEAGSECYEGQLAVGAVVMNRLRSGAYPSSLYDVIYQSGQFTPAGNGKVASVISSGVSGSCLQAAQEALSGVDNTGGALSFRRASSGQAGVVIGNHVFF